MKIPKSIWKLAEYEATLSPHRFRVGAVVFRNKYALGSGHNNHLKTHPKSPHPFKTIHAEFAAVTNALGNFFEGAVSNGRILVVRLKADGTYGLAKPCKYCMFMLNQVGIKDINWSEG